MSAIIWLGIVAVWGFVLIPMWLRHHDTTLEQRSAERFTTAMRVLSRRGSQRSSERFAVDGMDGAVGDNAPAAAADVTLGRKVGSASAAADSGAPPADTRGRVPRPAPRTAAEAARAAMVRARRQRLLVLLGAVPASLIVALIAGGMWFVVQVIVDAGLVGYVCYLRHAAKTDRRLRTSRAARDRQIAQDRAARASAWRSGASPALLSRPPSETGPRAAHREVRFASTGSTGSTGGSGRNGGYEGDGFHAGEERDDQHPSYDVASSETVDLSEAVAAANAAAGRSSDVETRRRPASESDYAPAHETGYDRDPGAESGSGRDLDYGADPRRVIEATAVEAAVETAADDDRYDEVARHEIVGDASAGYGHEGQDQPEYEPADHEVAQYDQQQYEHEVARYDAVGDGDGAAYYPSDEPASDVPDEGGAAEPYRTSPGRSGARPGRPNTSKPGRVQVNPPGTHGGLTAPPGSEAASASASASASGEHVPGDEGGDDLEALLSRHAAGA